MNWFKRLTEPQAAVVAASSEEGRQLVLERDFLRELVEAKNKLIVCYKLGQRPTERLLTKLERLEEMLFD